ncbi:toll/interleukin-1 receptor domain-containing protein [Xanthomonas hortorum]|uniref:toll/interleukin-1 receptor domain-containing protein n=1 Tax=Xanthomonas hortorum TaxID=56454 RepID=UPI0015946ADA|nr:toll/interleukin-1 receptor domain-containing protein [Xanthomonas hortorum]NHF67522.1 toll/interleukin-1 receptor domain-containing protein [Xanthomonas hortorum]
MARCTAPVRGHSSAAAAAACPACRYRSSSRYSSGSGGSYYPSTSSPSYTSSSSGSGRKNSKPRWSKTGSTILYTPTEVQSLTPVREAVEVQVARHPDKRDVFLCHAWDDRQGAAKELHDLLEAAGVKVWFSEKDLGLGVPMMRAIDKGLANSKVGLVLVTPALLARLPKESVADKELSTLLAGNRLVPIVHKTTYGALREVSPMLASRTGLDTAEDSMSEVAAKIAELVTF